MGSEWPESVGWSSRKVVCFCHCDCNYQRKKEKTKKSKERCKLQRKLLNASNQNLRKED